MFTTTSRRAERGDRGLDDVRGGVEVGDVVGVGDRLAAERADLLDDLVHRLVRRARAVGRAPEVVDHDLGALTCECRARASGRDHGPLQ